jgi:hypothetical protein
MRSRISWLWAFAGSVALVVVMALAYHPRFAPASGTGMSAPAAPVTSVEPEPVARLLRSHNDWTGQAVRLEVFSSTTPTALNEDRPEQDALSASRFYAPLYRRPPPSLS